MILTDLQVHILDLLTKLKWIKLANLKKLMDGKFKIADIHLHKILEQLCFLNRIQMNDEYIFLPYRARDEQMLTAIDIMLCFADGIILNFAEGTESCKLVFFISSENSQKVSVFKIIFVPKGKEALICAGINSIQHPSGCTMLFVLTDKSQIQLLHTDSKAYFVLKDGDNRYSFLAAK